ncbi:MAG: hypothetical protein LBO63_00325 [Oscillospiraceae bacterium]|jgi:hypothetical protein|nr:hypothetical protein [Oscillospiraceae bacterium]
MNQENFNAAIRTIINNNWDIPSDKINNIVSHIEIHDNYHICPKHKDLIPVILCDAYYYRGSFSNFVIMGGIGANPLGHKHMNFCLECGYSWESSN